jgi:cation-transporting ATPase E
VPCPDRSCGVEGPAASTRFLSVASRWSMQDGVDEMRWSINGLSAVEVASRVAAGHSNVVSTKSGRTVYQIVRANVFTRFNAILGSLFVVIVIVGPPQDGLFGLVLLINTTVGVAQELRARRVLDRLAILNAPEVHVMRGGGLSELALEDVVIDDIVELRPGDQVVADAVIVISRNLEVDESPLSGESQPIDKHELDTVLSGSVVIAGTATVKVTAVGDGSFAQQIQSDARRFSLATSELQNGINRILRMITWVMIPASVLLVTSQVVRSGQSIDQTARATVAGVGAMVPEGLVLLTTIAFALGALRLAQRRVLVQELAAIEGLARVDVVCVDKTGTLTEPLIELFEVVTFMDEQLDEVLGAMAGADPSPNATMRAASVLPEPADWSVNDAVPFSSERKWSAFDFRPHGTWVLGAPEIVTPQLSAQQAATVAQHLAAGRRVLSLARTSALISGDALPSGLVAAGLAVFEEQLRPDATTTVKYLLAQGVEIKVLSGDNPATVGSVAHRVGIPGAANPVDARSLPVDPGELQRVIDGSTVFGRVQPAQKRDIVMALQARGHVVAMTGDGINDIPALKAADLGIAMGSGSAATRAVGQIVLMDSSFESVPQLLDEGRRVIANVQRVAALFVTKTVYATVFAIVVGVTAFPYPFFPRHLTVVSTLTIGVPGFFLALAPGAPRAARGFVDGVLRFAIPAGVVTAAATMLAYVLARGPLGASNAQARTTATFMLLVLGLVVVILVARPLTMPRYLLVAAMAAGGVLVWVVPISRRVFALATPPADVLFTSLGVAVIAVPALVAARQIGRRVHRTANPSSNGGDKSEVR